MALLIGTADQLRVFRGALPQEKEGDINTPLLQPVQELRRVDRMGTIVKGQCRQLVGVCFCMYRCYVNQHQQ